MPSDEESLLFSPQASLRILAYRCDRLAGGLCWSPRVECIRSDEMQFKKAFSTIQIHEYIVEMPIFISCHIIYVDGPTNCNLSLAMIFASDKLRSQFPRSIVNNEPASSSTLRIRRRLADQDLFTKSLKRLSELGRIWQPKSLMLLKANGCTCCQIISTYT